MPWVVGVLLGAGLFLTVRTGFVQLRGSVKPAGSRSSAGQRARPAR